MEGTPLASFQGATLNRIPWSEWAFPGMARAPDPQGPHGGGWAVRGLWFVALPCSGEWDQPRVDQSGAFSSAKRANSPGTPLGPFEVADHAPFPRLPCLPNCSGVSRLFKLHRSLGLNCPQPAPPKHSGPLDALSSVST